MMVIKALYGDGHPVQVYKGTDKLAGWHDESKSGDSVSFSDTYNDTAEVDLSGNQNGLHDVGGNLLSNGAIVTALPPLRKIDAAKDSYIPKTGKKTKRISDWLNLAGSLNWAFSSRHYNFKRLYLGGFVGTYNNISPYETNVLAYKYDSNALTIANATLGTDRLLVGTNGVDVSVSDADSGFGDMIVPTGSELKAYFYGWKMCNADGTAPYYKSEVPYTPSTWVEWTTSNGVIKDASGLSIIGTGNAWKVASFNAPVKANTKYGFLYEVVSSSFTQPFILGNDFGWSTLPKTVGKQKYIKTSVASPINVYTFQTGTQNETGSIKLKDIRIFELPTGSQIEADFTNLTADQLAAKYTFNGLCVKNWKRVTDGLGQTAVLPTASYAGYTPYKMIYQLATSVEESYTPAPVPTYLGQTLIETDSIVKPTITATAKVTD